MLLAAACAASLVCSARPSYAVGSEMIVFLNSYQKLDEKKLPELSLFGFFFARHSQSVLGVYGGPRWKIGNFGVEAKLGVYGGADYPAKAIINNQIDYTLKYLSVTSFTDYYPTQQIYSYLSTFLTFGPLNVGGVADVTYDWSDKPFKTMSKGPSIGLATKYLYLGTSYIFRTDRSQSIRMTVGVTL
jgi:hypothetical protein